MSFFLPARNIIRWVLLFSFFFAFEGNASDNQYYYFPSQQHKYSPEDILELYKKGQLLPSSSKINLGIEVHDIWVLIKPEDMLEDKYVVFENAHLDTITAYFFHGDTLTSTAETGDRLNFHHRSMQENFPNVKIPQATTMVLLNVRTEGSMLVPFKIFTAEKYFSYFFQYGLLHWVYFGFIFLILLSSVIVWVWLKENIYLYYILAVATTGFISGVDTEYSFQYLWPDHPEVNKYNIAFYALTIFTFLFSEKLFNISKELPRLYVVYKIVYVVYAIMMVVILVAPYNTGLKSYMFFDFAIKILSLGTAIYYFIYFRNATSVFFLMGWLVYSLASIFYSIYVAGSLPYSAFFNNLFQISSGVQFILFNTAVLSNINIINIKAKEEIEATSNITVNSIFNGMLQSIWMVDRNFHLVKWNDKFKVNVKSILKIDLDDSKMGKHVKEIFSQEEVEFWTPLYNRVLAGEDIHFERRYPNNARIIEYYLYPMIINKVVTNIFIISNDITDRIETSEVALKNEITLKSILNSIQQGIWILDRNLNVVQYNEKLAQNIKSVLDKDITPDIVGKQLNGINPDERSFWDGMYKRGLSGEQVYFEKKWEGTGRIFEYNVYPIYVNEEVVSIFVLSNEITEKVKQQEDLSNLVEKIKEQEASLSALINSTTDYIFSLDLNYHFTEFNIRFREVIPRAYGVELKKGMCMWDFVPENLQVETKESYSIAMEGKSTKQILEHANENGTVTYIDLAFSPIFNENRKVIGITVFARDITENKEAEKELIEINNQIVQYKLVALRSVMNPHFLFNSLNSIQYFVAKNERKLALDYLSLFSSLIRKILNSSVSNSVPLNIELEILSTYILLEKLRFEGKFDYTIEVDPEIEVDTIQIPSLLIQPYVENAILHGLMNKEEGLGILKIRLFMDGSYLIFEVEDNGVGREKAYEIKRNRPIKEKSYGMLLTQERLDILNKTATVAVRIEDLKNEKGEPAGTKVIVSIKV